MVMIKKIYKTDSNTQVIAKEQSSSDCNCYDTFSTQTR